MPDEPAQKPSGADGVFDDDRLLAYALRLEDDPELLRAAGGDAALAGRLAAMRRDVAAVESGIAAAAPVPDAEYADPRAARWADLHGCLEAPAARRRRGRAPRWWRVVAPVSAAVVVALTVGLVALDRGQQTGTPRHEAAAPSVESAAGSTADNAARATLDAEGYAVVVVARPRAASGTRQSFRVVRVLKGEAPRIITLRVGRNAAAAGRLHLLMLLPAGQADAYQADGSTAPSPPASKSARLATTRTAGYVYRGQPVLARELPAGTDPREVRLP